MKRCSFGKLNLHNRTHVFLVLLLVSLSILLLQRVLAYQFRQPKLVFKNREGSGPITATCGRKTLKIARVEKGESVILPFKLAPGQTYTIQGIEIPDQELSRIVPIARANGTDIQLEIDFHGCLVIEGHELNAIVVR